jgi:hypothetical protein
MTVCGSTAHSRGEQRRVRRAEERRGEERGGEEEEEEEEEESTAEHSRTERHGTAQTNSRDSDIPALEHIRDEQRRRLDATEGANGRLNVRHRRCLGH